MFSATWCCKNFSWKHVNLHTATLRIKWPWPDQAKWLGQASRVSRTELRIYLVSERTSREIVPPTRMHPAYRGAGHVIVVVVTRFFYNRSAATSRLQSSMSMDVIQFQVCQIIPTRLRQPESDDSLFCQYRYRDADSTTWFLHTFLR